MSFQGDFWEGVLRRFFLELAQRHRMLGRTRRGGEATGLLDWARRFLPDHCRHVPSRMHRWLGERLDLLHEDRGTKLNLLAPRGAAKSTLGTLAYPLREALEGREPYIWIVSDTMSQARAHLDNIKTELLANELLQRQYPAACGKGERWQGGGIILRNGIAIEAYGTGQRLRGRRRKQYRPSLIICDDLQNERHILSAEAREKSRDWFNGTLLKAGSPTTNVLNLATALHREAIALELLEKPGWVSKRFRAIEQWPEDMALWERWETLYTDTDNLFSAREAASFYRDNKEAMDAGAALLWPEHEDLETLMRMRVESGRTAFEREKQNEPINPEHCEWPESYFDEPLWYENLPQAGGIVARTMALDPSKGRDAVRSDYSAFVVLALGRDGTYYVEANLARRPVPEIVADGVALYEEHRPDLFGVEANQFQELLRDELEAAFFAAGMPGVLVFPLSNTTSKTVRIRRLGPLLSAKRLRFKTNSPSTKLLVEQLKIFPVGDHDDGPDALEMALQLMNRLLTPDDRGHDTLGGKLNIGS